MTAAPAAARADAARADAIEAMAFADLFAAAPHSLAQRLGLGVDHDDGTLGLRAAALPVTIFNRVIGFGDRPTHDAALLQRIAGRYRQAGIGHWWLHHNPVTAQPGSGALLQAAGLVPARRRRWAKMLRGVEPLDVSTTLQLHPATGAEAVAVAGCIAQSFGMPPPIVDWLAALHGRPGWTVLAICDGGTPVGGACLYVHADTGWLGMGGVLPSHRRRGGQLASMALRIALAAAAGCRAVATETGEPVDGEPNPSLANMARAGFRQVASRYNLEPGPQPA
jgi:hypothetical protein